MVGRAKIRSREHGLERTDNDLEFTSWPQVGMINQKNYYTEFLKRDDQILVYRLQNEENRNRMARAARDKDRAFAQSGQAGVAPMPEAEADVDDTMAPEETVDGVDTFGSKVVVIQPGSQFMRIGLASDVLPKTIPMVVARRSTKAEAEEQAIEMEADLEPKPKRRRVGEALEPFAAADESFQEVYTNMTTDLKGRLKRKGVRFVPNTREQAAAWNRKSNPDMIPEHNDTHHIDWTEVLPNNAKETYTGQAALRIPERSNPPYKLHWPIKYGGLNEADYDDRGQLLRDFTTVIEDTLRNQLGMTNKRERIQYGCVFVIPDLYEKRYVTTVLELLFREFGFGRVCFIQESLSASFGAGTSTCCIVDIGAQKTSICCVDEGMCVENSRINLKFGGADVTAAFAKMMLGSHFPYADISLNRRYNLLVRDELKQKCCTLSYADLSNGSQFFEIYVRAFRQDTRFYRFKAYDEVMLAPMGYYRPELFDNSEKLRGKRRLIPRSYDLYDGSPNDPLSSAQAQLLANIAAASDGDTLPSAEVVEPVAPAAASTPNRQEPLKSNELLNGIEDMARYASAGSPAQRDGETPQPARPASPMEGERDNVNPPVHPLMEMLRSADLRDRTLPIMPLDQAIALSIEHGARGDERKMRDFFGGIIPIGGGSQINGFNQFLEEELAASQPKFRKEVIVAPPPREMDPQVLVWKGASVFGKLRVTNDSWISELEYDRLGSRCVNYKVQWNW